MGGICGHLRNDQRLFSSAPDIHPLEHLPADAGSLGLWQARCVRSSDDRRSRILYFPPLADERLGEVPGAVVYFHPGQGVTVEALTEFLKGQLAAFKVPQQIWISAEPLPRLGTEKIDKVTLRNDYRAVWAKMRG